MSESKKNADREPTAAQEALAGNLRMIRERGTSYELLARHSGVAKNTIYSMADMKADPSVGNVERVAGVIGLRAADLLLPMEDETEGELLEIIGVYRASGPLGREIMRAVAETVSREYSSR